MQIKLNPEKRSSNEAEKIESVEYYKDSVSETEKVSDQSSSTIEKSVKVPNIKSVNESQGVSSNLIRQVEGIMEEDLEDLYRDLSDAEKLIFKKKGEETASYISQLLKQAKIKIKDIFKALVSWLKYLPGVNRAFIEQEAKIKTDALLKIKRK